MKRGFMDFAATRLIPDDPGHTAAYYAKVYIDIAGKDASDAKYPPQSLANTLSKQVATGSEKRIKRQKVAGQYCFFPAISSSSAPQQQLNDIAVQILLSAEELNILDDFVAVGRFNSRSHAATWLTREGIKARQPDIERVESIRKRIDELKASVPQI